MCFLNTYTCEVSRRLLAEPKAGVEPTTPGLFGRCSTLSYLGMTCHLRIPDSESGFPTDVGAWVTGWWGGHELNMRPPALACRHSTLSYRPVRNCTSLPRFHSGRLSHRPRPEGWLVRAAGFEPAPTVRLSPVGDCA